jgi:hypothetical protein
LSTWPKKYSVVWESEETKYDPEKKQEIRDEVEDFFDSYKDKVLTNWIGQVTNVRIAMHDAHSLTIVTNDSGFKTKTVNEYIGMTYLIWFMADETNS